MRINLKNAQILIAIIPLAITCTIFDWITVLLPIKYFTTGMGLLYISQLEICIFSIWFLANTSVLFVIKRKCFA